MMNIELNGSHFIPPKATVRRDSWHNCTQGHSICRSSTREFSLAKNLRMHWDVKISQAQS